MFRHLLLTGCAAATVSCTSTPSSEADSPANFVSESPSTFQLVWNDEADLQQLLTDSVIFGSSSRARVKEVGGHSALEIKTSSEFSDTFVDVKKLFGHTINFSQGGYLSMQLWVPQESWISAMKFNFRDTLGNFGGGAEVFNNFYGHYDQWMNVTADVQDIAASFKNWVGDDNPLPQVAQFSFNPYNAHQADSSVVYVRDIRFTAEQPEETYNTALATLPEQLPNIPYELNFDDEATLRQLTAYRSFESSCQAFAKGVAGNNTRAIRIKGSDQNEHIAFLPIFDKMTGKPVDFTQVRRLYFSYYLTEDSDSFDGSWLYLADEHWNNLLIDKNFYRDFVKGSWQQVSVDVKDINLARAHGEGEVLPHVYELRLGINYLPGKKNIEIWIDDFGWE